MLTADWRAALAMLVGVSLTTPAQAQFAQVPEHISAWYRIDDRDHGASPQMPKSKSPGLGLMLALGNTIIPTYVGAVLLRDETAVALGAILLIYGGVVGPSIGEFYAGSHPKGLAGLAIRAGALAAISVVTTGGTWDENGSNSEENVIVAGLVVSLASAIWNVASVPSSVRRFNERHSLSFRPTFDAEHGRLGFALLKGF